jgi:hypothetical protein
MRFLALFVFMSGEMVADLEPQSKMRGMHDSSASTVP